MWVGGCVTAPAAWASGSSALASRGPWSRRCRGTRGPARSRERPCHGDAGVYTDRRKRPHGAVLGHSCTLLRRCGQAWGQRSVHRLAKIAFRSRFGAFVYTVATQGSRKLRRELRRVARVPQPPWCAGGAPSVAIFSWLKELCAVRKLRPTRWTKHLVSPCLRYALVLVHANVVVRRRHLTAWQSCRQLYILDGCHLPASVMG